MKRQLSEERYAFVSNQDKNFIIAFDEAMRNIGYESGGILPYVCFGKYKIEYAKSGIKTKKYVARFYFRDDHIVLRLYFTNIDKHHQFIENAPEFIKSSFTSEAGKCGHCANGFNKNGSCNFRKTYTIDGKTYEKCSGSNFYFFNHETENVPQYIELLTTFYPNKKGGNV